MESTIEHVPAAPQDDTEAVGRGTTTYPIVLLVLLTAVNNGDKNVTSVIFPLLKEEFHLTDSALGLFSGLFAAVIAVAAIPSGVAADRWVRTRIVAWGSLAWSAAMLLVGRSTNYASLLVTRSILGAAESTFHPVSFSLVTDYSPPTKRAKNLGLLQLGGIFGGLLVGVAGVIADAWGWRAAMYALALPGFVLALLTLRLPEPVRGAHDAAGGEHRSGISTRAAFGAIVRVPSIAVTLVVFVSTAFYMAGMAIWMPTFMVRYHDFSISGAAGALAAIGIVGAVSGTLVGGVVSDRLVRRSGPTGRLPASGMALLVTTGLLFVAFVSGNTVLFVLALTAGNFTVASAFPGLIALCADVCHPHLRGRFGALSTVLTSVAGIFAPLLFGIVSDLQTLRFAFLVVLPVLGAGGLVLLSVGPRLVRADLARQLEGTP
jgi:MFS family permease